MSDYDPSRWRGFYAPFYKPFYVDSSPNNGVFDEPLVSLCFNEEFLPYIQGALKALASELTWRGPKSCVQLWVQSFMEILLEDPVDGCGSVPEVSIPIGGIIYWTSPFLPEKWLSCDGSAYSRETYSELFGVLGVTFGFGDGETTFNIPNLLDRFPDGANNSRALQIGNVGGASGFTLAVDNLPAHHHRERTIRGSSPFYNEASTSTGGGATSFNTVANTAQTNGTPVDLNTADTGVGDEVHLLPPYLALHPIIYAGV